MFKKWASVALSRDLRASFVQISWQAGLLRAEIRVVKDAKSDLQRRRVKGGDKVRRQRVQSGLVPVKLSPEFVHTHTLIWFRRKRLPCLASQVFFPLATLRVSPLQQRQRQQPLQ
jgi:hypothetical protein